MHHCHYYLSTMISKNNINGDISYAIFIAAILYSITHTVTHILVYSYWSILNVPTLCHANFPD